MTRATRGSTQPDRLSRPLREAESKPDQLAQLDEDHERPHEQGERALQEGGPPKNGSPARTRDRRIVPREPDTVEMTKTRGKQVYLGIDAPRHVQVLRSNAKKRTPRKEPAAP